MQYRRGEGRGLPRIANRRTCQPQFSGGKVVVWCVAQHREPSIGAGLGRLWPLFSRHSLVLIM